MSPINSLGYGVAGLNIYKSLSKITETNLWVIGQPEVSTKEDYEAVTNGLKNAQNWSYDAPCVKIWHQHDMAQFVGRGKRIGFPFFELDQFSDIEKHNLNSLDQILVTSEWGKGVVLDQTNVTNVEVVPLGVNATLFRPSEYQYSDKTVFFNAGKWEIRKGHDVLVELFNNAFTKDDDVELWMMCSNPFLSEEETKEWENLYLKSKLGEKIKMIPRLKTHEEVYNIMTNIDCGIFPSRAEGWNLELLECMSCGKQVITTNYSAHREFCDNNNSYLVNICDKELAYDGKWFHGKCGSWAKINQDTKDALVEHMRHVHKNKELNTHGILTGQNFTWHNSAQKMVKYV